MRKISKFVHEFNLGEHIALWHSLRMKPVFLDKKTYGEYKMGAFSKELEEVLIANKILLASDDEDEVVLAWVRRNIPGPDVGLAYFILSENCNLACRYCFVGSDACGKGTSFKKDMSPEIADRAIDAFARQMESSHTDYENNPSDIIFFGGEPLMNFDVLRYTVERVNELKANRPVLAHTNFAVITNGTLLTEKRILELAKMNVAVSISIDGFTEKANENRVDKAGNSTFGRVIEVLESYKRLSVEPPSLSITLSEKTLDDLSGMLELINNYRIKGFGYNVLLQKDSTRKSTEYYEKASRFIIESFLALRDSGVYEDRIMRKLNSFASSRIHFSDCGATSGGQILFTPDGRIGICQGLMSEDENYVADIWDDSFIAAEHPFWKMWSSLVPLNNDGCLDCEALGICGGGCPVNARLINPEKGLHCIDDRSCIHSKKTLEFLVKDLYRLALVENKETNC